MNDRQFAATLQDTIAAQQPEAFGWTRAVYQPQEVPGFAGNPFIEALPPLRSKREALSLMRRGSPTTDAIRALSAQARMHAASDLSNVIEPLGRNLELHYAMDVVLRRGYAARNPMEGGFWNTDALVAAAASYRKAGISQAARDQAMGLSLIGKSGLGKTKAVQVVVDGYPGVVLHESYGGRPFRMLQIPWLVVGLTSDGTTRNLLPLIFRQVDELTGVTDYVSMYVSGRPSEQSMLEGLYRVIHLHGVGGLIFDEVQNLNQARSGGAEKMMNFFTVLANVVRVPVMLVGDDTTVNVAAGALRQARRSSGIGLPHFKPLPLDREFELLCRTLWGCLVLRETGPLLPLHIAALHDLSQGFPDMVAKLLMAAQQTALMSGIEDIADGLLRDANDRRLPLMQPHLARVRGGDPLDEALLAAALASDGGTAHAPDEGSDLPVASPPATPSPARQVTAAVSKARKASAKVSKKAAAKEMAATEPMVDLSQAGSVWRTADDPRAA